MARRPQTLQGAIPDFSVDGVRDPENPEGPRVEVVFPGDLLHDYASTDPVKFRNFEIARAVLLDPQRILRAVRRLENEPYWCYTGRPEQIFKFYDAETQEETRIPLGPHRLFAVYTQRNVVYEWRPLKASETDPTLPSADSIAVEREQWTSPTI